MTTLTDLPPRFPFTPGQSPKTWLGGLSLLSALLTCFGFGGIVTLLSDQPLAASPDVDLGVAHVPEPIALASLFCVGMALAQWCYWQVGHMERQGWELLRAGRPDQALPAFEVAFPVANGSSRARCLHGLALACLRTGDYERALQEAEKLTYSRRGNVTTFRTTVAPALQATILALYGELDEARSHVEDIQRPLFDMLDYALLAEAVVLCRESRYVEAVRRMQLTPRENIPELDVGAVAVLHAFARGQLGVHAVALKSGCVLPEKPARASEHEYLAREWPELAAWLRGGDAGGPGAYNAPR